MEAPKTNTVRKWSNVIFWFVEILAQITGVTLLVTVGVWVNKFHGGFDWGKSPGTFSYHSFFGIFGLVFICGQAIMFIEIPKRFKVSVLVQKAVHASIHTCAMIFAIVSLRAAILNKDLNSGKHLYSIHSWLGVTVIILFFNQYVVACVLYGLARLIGKWLTDIYQATHAYIGLFIFILALATCLTGFTEVVQEEIDNHASLPPTAVFANIICLLLVLFGAAVAYVASRPTHGVSTAAPDLAESSLEKGLPVTDEKDQPSVTKGLNHLDTEEHIDTEKDNPILNKALPYTEAELSNPEAECSNPEADFSKPGAELFKPEAELDKPEAEFARPQAELAKPEAELSKPEAELPNPEAELSNPEIEPPIREAGISNAEAGLPNPEA